MPIYRKLKSREWRQKKLIENTEAVSIMANLNVNFVSAKSKKIVLIISLILATSVINFGQKTSSKSNNNSKAEQEILKINEEFDRAIVKRNVSEYDRILADDFIFTDFSGKVTNKAQELEKLKSGDLKFEFGKSEDVRVKIYGTTAVVTGRFTARGQNKGNNFTFFERYTAVFVKRNGRWQMVAEQSTEIPEK